MLYNLFQADSVLSGLSGFSTLSDTQHPFVSSFAPVLCLIASCNYLIVVTANRVKHDN